MWTLLDTEKIHTNKARLHSTVLKMLWLLELAVKCSPKHFFNGTKYCSHYKYGTVLATLLTHLLTLTDTYNSFSKNIINIAEIVEYDSFSCSTLVSRRLFHLITFLAELKIHHYLFYLLVWQYVATSLYRRRENKIKFIQEFDNIN